MLTTEHELDLGAEAKRVDVALTLLALAKARHGVLICSYRTVAVTQLVELLEFNRSRLNYVMEVDPSRSVDFTRARDGVRLASPKERVETASWQPGSLSKPAGSSECFAANLGKASLGEVENLTCFALSIDGIKRYQRGVLVGMTSLELDDKLKNLAQLLAWTHWIRVAVRKAKRTRSPLASNATPESEQLKGSSSFKMLVRSNRRIAAGHDVRAAEQRTKLPERPVQLRRRLTAGKTTLNVVELFAGAGDMGLGFLSAHASGRRGYRIAGSAEIDPIFTQTLRQNHAYMEQKRLTPCDTTQAEYAPIDLCFADVRERLHAVAK